MDLADITAKVATRRRVISQVQRRLTTEDADLAATQRVLAGLHKAEPAEAPMPWLGGEPRFAMRAGDTLAPVDETCKCPLDALVHNADCPTSLAFVAARDAAAGYDWNPELEVRTKPILLDGARAQVLQALCLLHGLRKPTIDVNDVADLAGIADAVRAASALTSLSELDLAGFVDGQGWTPTQHGIYLAAKIKAQEKAT